MIGWESWKKSFDTWESHTAKLLEQVLKSETVLTPVGNALSATMRIKAASDRVVAAWWGAIGLPTRRDQERTLHALNELQSRVFDLEEKLSKASTKKN